MDSWSLHMRESTARMDKGMDFFPDEQEKQYQDLKWLKNVSLFSPQGLRFPSPEDSSVKAVQPLIDDLEQDCLPLVPGLPTEDRVTHDKTDLGSDDWRQKPFLVPDLSLLQTNENFDKTSLIPDLPPPEEELDELTTHKKQVLWTPDDRHVLAPKSFGVFQPISEDAFVSIQTKKGCKVPSGPREELNYSFMQNELKQSQQVNHFVPRTVQYSTKQALKELVEQLPNLPTGTHGCIVEEGYNPDCQEYIENVHFITEKWLGNGSFGRVDLIIDSTSNKKVVRKQVEKSQMQVGEVIIPLNLNSDHVTKIIGLIQRQNGDAMKIELLLEYAGPSLNQYLIQEGNSLTPDQIWKLTKQALSGLAHIHTYGMIHLDVKPENLCIQVTEDKLLLKVTDFGSAKLPYEDINFNGWTPEYMAPESCQYFLQMAHKVQYSLGPEDITGKVDVFALFLVIGYMYSKKHVLLALMTHGKGSYGGLTAEEKRNIQTQLIMMLATSNGTDLDALIHDSCDLDMRDLLKEMSGPRENRVTAREALAIVEKREQIQLQMQREKELKLQMLQEQWQRKLKVVESTYIVPAQEETNLPATVGEMSFERSIIKDKLREKLLPYKKSPRPEAPKTPLTPVEEMKLLQIKTEKTKSRPVPEKAQYKPSLKTIREQQHHKPPLNMIREEQSFPMTETQAAVRQITEPVRPPKASLITTSKNSGRMPVPALLMTQPSSSAVKMDYSSFIDLSTQNDGFIDLKTQKQEFAELQGNIPNILFD